MRYGYDEHLGTLETIHHFTISDGPFDSPDRHPVAIRSQPTPIGHWPGEHSHAPRGFVIVLVVTDEMLPIPRVLLHRLVTLNTLEHDLAEAVEVRDVS